MKRQDAVPTEHSSYEGPSRILSVLRDSRSVLWGVFGFSVVLNFLMLTPSLYMLQVYDRVLSSRSESTLLVLSLLVLGMYLMLSVLDQIRGAVMVRLSVWLDRRLSENVFRSAFEYASRLGSAGGAATSDLATIRQLLGSPIPGQLFDAPLTIVFLGASFFIDVWLGVFVALSIVVLVVLAVLNEHLSRPLVLDAGQAGNVASNYMSSAFRNVEAIRALGMLSDVCRRWLALNGDALDKQCKASDVAARVGAVSKFVRLSAQSMSLGLGAWLVLENRMTPGMMIAGSILLGRALAPIEGLIVSWRQLVAAQGAMGRLEKLLRDFPVAEEHMELPTPRGVLSVEGLCLAPPGSETLVVRDISLKLEAGQILGIIGPSGSGKSSLARGLVGVWDPAKGAVRLDGAELSHWPEAQRSAAIGYLPQDVQLFEASIAENIARLGTIDSAAVVTAAKAAGIHEMVLRLPAGYETKIGPGGVVLSGGQRQRVGLARALYRQPVLVVLDEPNSNLDDAGERALLEMLESSKREGRTVVLISHKIPVLAAADFLLVMRDGNALLGGPRDAVLAELAKLNNQSSAPARQQAVQAVQGGQHAVS